MLTFVWMIGQLGILAEQNPVIHAVGPSVSVLLKVGVVAIALLAIHEAQFRPKDGPHITQAVTAAAVVVGMIGATSNILAVWHG